MRNIRPPNLDWKLKLEIMSAGDIQKTKQGVYQIETWRFVN